MKTVNTTPPIHKCGNCNACVFVEASDELKAQNLKAEGQHECRALPPQLIVAPVQIPGRGVTMAPAVAWPKVDPDNGWCRMHSALVLSASVAANGGQTV